MLGPRLLYMSLSTHSLTMLSYFHTEKRNNVERKKTAAAVATAKTQCEYNRNEGKKLKAILICFHFFAIARFCH